MNRTAVIVLTLFLPFSAPAFACKNEQGKYLELSVDSSLYATKPDKSKPAKPTFLSKKAKHPSLYCSRRSGAKCDENSVWFSSEEFAKYLVNYKPVHCHHVVSTFKLQSGVQTNTTSFKVYYVGK